MFAYFYITVIISVVVMFLKQSKLNTFPLKLNMVQKWIQIMSPETEL